MLLLWKNKENQKEFSNIYLKKNQFRVILYKIEFLSKNWEVIMAESLKKLSKFNGVSGPVLTIVMDGVGIAPATEANAVAGAYTPTLDMLMAKYPTVTL